MLQTEIIFHPVSDICRLITADCGLRLLFQPFTEQNSVAPNSQTTANYKQPAVKANRKQTAVKINRNYSLQMSHTGFSLPFHTQFLNKKLCLRTRFQTFIDESSISSSVLSSD